MPPLQIASRNNETKRELQIFRDERVLVGMLGMLLPWVLVLGCAIHGGEPSWLPTISDYYYSSMGNWLVGVLFAVAAFLCVYRDVDKLESWMGLAAALGMVGVALCPCHSALRYVHYVAAAVTFIVLGLMSLISFASSDQSPRLQPVYRAFGAAILACVAGIGALGLVFGQAWVDSTSVIWGLETVALTLFAVSWLLKGWEDVRARRARR